MSKRTKEALLGPVALCVLLYLSSRESPVNASVFPPPEPPSPSRGIDEEDGNRMRIPDLIPTPTPTPEKTPPVNWEEYLSGAIPPAVGGPETAITAETFTLAYQAIAREFAGRNVKFEITDQLVFEDTFCVLGQTAVLPGTPVTAPRLSSGLPFFFVYDRGSLTKNELPEIAQKLLVYRLNPKSEDFESLVVAVDERDAATTFLETKEQKPVKIWGAFRGGKVEIIPNLKVKKEVGVRLIIRNPQGKIVGYLSPGDRIAVKKVEYEENGSPKTIYFTEDFAKGEEAGFDLWRNRNLEKMIILDTSAWSQDQEINSPEAVPIIAGNLPWRPEGVNLLIPKEEAEKNYQSILATIAKFNGKTAYRQVEIIRPDLIDAVWPEIRDTGQMQTNFGDRAPYVTDIVDVVITEVLTDSWKPGVNGVDSVMVKVKKPGQLDSPAFAYLVLHRGVPFSTNIPGEKAVVMSVAETNRGITDLKEIKALIGQPIGIVGLDEKKIDARLANPNSPALAIYPPQDQPVNYSVALYSF